MYLCVLPNAIGCEFIVQEIPYIRWVIVHMKLKVVILAPPPSRCVVRDARAALGPIQIRCAKIPSNMAGMAACTMLVFISLRVAFTEMA